MQDSFRYQERFRRLGEVVKVYLEAERDLTEKCLNFVDQDNFQGIKDLMEQKKRISARTRALQRFLAAVYPEDLHARA